MIACTRLIITLYAHSFVYEICPIRQVLFASVLKIQISFTSWSKAGLYEMFCVHGTVEHGQPLQQETTGTAIRFKGKEPFLKFGLIQNALRVCTT